MQKYPLRIATRQSQLALWQANHIAALLKEKHPELEITIVGMTTTGDQILDQSLMKVGGKGLFTKEIEQALLSNQADCAVHSLKDLPPQAHPTLSLAAITKRFSAADLFLSERFSSWQQLPEGATVGSSSLRRQSQLLHLRPDLNITLLRGNIDTRLKKLKNDDYDAIILAEAGIMRLNLQTHFMQPFSIDEMLPAAGQGALGLQCRSDDDYTLQLLQSLACHETTTCISAERAFVEALNGNCQTPIGAYAKISNHHVILTGLIANVDGKRMIRQAIQGEHRNASELGRTLASRCLAGGGESILDEMNCHQTQTSTVQK